METVAYGTGRLALSKVNLFDWRRSLDRCVRTCRRFGRSGLGKEGRSRDTTREEAGHFARWTPDRIGAVAVTAGLVEISAGAHWVKPPQPPILERFPAGAHSGSPIGPLRELSSGFLHVTTRRTESTHLASVDFEARHERSRSLFQPHAASLHL